MLRSRSCDLTAVAILLLGFVLAACAPRATGPPFSAAMSPAADRARLYLYRVDPRPSISPVRIRVNGRDLGILHDGEYATLELPPGARRIEAGVRSVAFVAWGWNDQHLRIAPGETAYVEISVRLTERTQPASRSLDIAGRPGGAVSENVYLRPTGEADALEALRQTTRRVPTP